MRRRRYRVQYSCKFQMSAGLKTPPSVVVVVSVCSKTIVILIQGPGGRSLPEASRMRRHTATRTSRSRTNFSRNGIPHPHGEHILRILRLPSCPVNLLHVIIPSVVTPSVAALGFHLAQEGLDASLNSFIGLNIAAVRRRAAPSRLALPSVQQTAAAGTSDEQHEPPSTSRKENAL